MAIIALYSFEKNRDSRSSKVLHNLNKNNTDDG